MSKVAFRQADIARVLRAFTSEGLPPPRIEIDPGGKIIALPLQSPAPANQGDELDAMIRASATNGKG